MGKVYAAIMNQHYQSSDILGIYESREDAEKAIEHYREQQKSGFYYRDETGIKQWSKPQSYDSYEVEEHELHSGVPEHWSGASADNIEGPRSEP